MPVDNKSRQSSYKDLVARCMIRYTSIMLDLCPILCRQIESNNQLRFRLKADGDKETGIDSSGRESRRVLSSFKNDTHRYNQVLTTEELDTYNKWNRVHFATCMSLYFIELFRYSFIHLMSLNSLAEYRYLDCYLLGRFRFVGRGGRISSIMILIFVVAFILFRYITFVIKPRFTLQVVEFLLHKYEHVVESEREFNSSQRTGNNIARPVFWSTEAVSELESRTEFGLIQPNSILYLRNHFHGNSIDCKWILRPNRTSKSWIILRSWVRFGFYTYTAVYILFISTIFYSIFGFILTNLGYELSYATCAAFIQSKQWGSGGATNLTATLAGSSTALVNRNELPYSHIYRAPQKLARQMRIEDLPAFIPLSQIDLQSMNAYNLMRIAADVITNLFWYTQFISLVGCGYCAMVLFSVDIIINAKEVEKRLKKIIERWKALQSSSSNDLLTTNQRGLPIRQSVNRHDDGAYFVQFRSRTLYCRFRSRSGFVDGQSVSKHRLSRDDSVPLNRDENKRLGDEITKESTIVQAILHDHFLLVRDYNNLVSFYFTFLMIIFIMNTLFISYWTNTIKSRTVELEFVVAEAIVAILFVIFLFTAALARSVNFKLAALINKALTLETNQEAKRRWTSIISYYKPRPLYCFTIFGSTEISWLFCVKVSSLHSVIKLPST